MTFLNEVKARLDALGTLGTLTIGTMPGSPDAVGTIYGYGGQAPMRRFGVAGIAYEKPSIQVVFRGLPNDYAGPEAKAHLALKELMAILPDTVLSGTKYLQIDPQQSPFPTQPKDANNRHYIGFNAYIMKEPTA